MFYFIIIVGVFLDLLSKFVAKVYLQDKLNIFWDYLYFEYFENTWIAFSIQIPSFFLKIITISLIILIFYYYNKEIKIDSNKWFSNLLSISFGLILAWAIWNAYERIFNEKVVDFIWIKHFSVFNLADSFIFIWALFYLFILYKNNKLWVFDQTK